MCIWGSRFDSSSSSSSPWFEAWLSQCLAQGWRTVDSSLFSSDCACANFCVNSCRSVCSSWILVLASLTACANPCCLISFKSRANFSLRSSFAPISRCSTAFSSSKSLASFTIEFAFAKETLDALAPAAALLRWSCWSFAWSASFFESSWTDCSIRRSSCPFLLVCCLLEASSISFFFSTASINFCLRASRSCSVCDKACARSSTL
mmetsp:Transcript_87826/g.248912  ORF Transcript_87826/g.248912 Transcript_87826/m.248912 type:complete len:206 (-) Transcript_87826:239-856(-)